MDEAVTMTGNTLEQRARELLAAEYDRKELLGARDRVADGGKLTPVDMAALRAIESALRLSAGADWVLVPREPTNEMFEAAASFGGGGGYSRQRGFEAVESWAHMLAAAPRHETGE